MDEQSGESKEEVILCWDQTVSQLVIEVFVDAF